MYKLVIADDEPLVQVGIKSMLDWGKLNIEVACIASNGRVALDYIQENPVDIVITDIKMPIMSGLELAKACYESFGADGPAFIVLTSFDDFKLAQEAIRYQVCEYLIKLELTPDALSNAVTSITKKLDSKTATAVEQGSIIESFSDKFFIMLLHNLFENNEQFQLQAKELKLNFDHESYTCAFFEIKRLGNITDTSAKINLYHSAYQMCHELFDKYGDYYCILLDLHHFAVIFTDVEYATIIQNSQTVSDTIKNYYNASLICGIGTKVSSPAMISESFQAARDAYCSASLDSPMVAIADLNQSLENKKSFNLSIFKDSLSRAFEEFDNELLEKTIGDIIDLFKSHPGHSLQAMDCTSNILYMAISLIPNGEEIVTDIFTDTEASYRSLFKLNSSEQIIDWLCRLSKGLCDYFIEHKKDTRKPIVANIKRYIQANVTDHLSLNEVAAVFGLSPNYLSQLFTKFNDCGFNEYVTTCKINEARRLLSSGDYKVYEVSEMLGFENAFYFSKVFKKVVGVPPTTFMTNGQ